MEVAQSSEFFNYVSVFVVKFDTDSVLLDLVLRGRVFFLTVNCVSVSQYPPDILCMRT